MGRAVFSFISPSIVALTLYRISRWLYGGSLRPLSWLLYTINLYLTGADIPPRSSIGRACLLAHANGMIINGCLGNRVTLYARAGIGGGRGEGDVGGGPGVPVLDDDVMVGVNATIMGPIRIGRGSVVGAHAVVIGDVPAYSVVMGVPGVVRPITRDAITSSLAELADKVDLNL